MEASQESIELAVGVDPLTGFGTRERLLADLEAVSFGTVAVFNLSGLVEFEEAQGRIRGEGLLVQIARTLEETVGPGVRYYRPRHDEFAVLIESDAEDRQTGLAAAVDETNRRLERSQVVLEYGLAMPAEVTDGLAALMLADQRLFLHSPSRRSRERRAPVRT
jgi:GGDEF domain-containing protein